MNNSAKTPPNYEFTQSYANGEVKMETDAFNRMYHELMTLRKIAEAASKWRSTMREEGSDSQEH